MRLFLYACLYVALFFFILSVSSPPPAPPAAPVPPVTAPATPVAPAPVPAQYAILIDAGSSGSRIHVYEVHHAPGETLPEIRPPMTSPKWTHKIEPGISSFHGNPGDLADYLLPLLQFALEVVRPDHAAGTPLFLMATAGMRLLSPEAQNSITSQLCVAIALFPFSFSCDQVQVISGEMEGLYGWVTVNYLLRTLSSSAPAASRPVTNGFLDLGGASTQIAFEMGDRDDVDGAAATPVSPVTAAIRLNLSPPAAKSPLADYVIYSASHLEFGANEARHRYVHSQVSHPDFPTESVTVIRDPCLPRDKVFDYSFALAEFPEFEAKQLKHLTSVKETLKPGERNTREVVVSDPTGEALPESLITEPEAPRFSSRNPLSSPPDGDDDAGDDAGDDRRMDVADINSLVNNALEPETEDGGGGGGGGGPLNEVPVTGEQAEPKEHFQAPAEIPTAPPADTDAAPAFPTEPPSPTLEYLDPALPRKISLVGSGEFAECLREIEEHDLLQTTLPCRRPPCSVKGAFQPEINHLEHRFVAISEFWYTLFDVHGMHEYDFRQFSRASEDFCALSWPTLLAGLEAGHYPNADLHRLETQCFKSAWVVSLLHTGFGFPLPTYIPDDTNVLDAKSNYRVPMFTREISGIEVSWTLGALLVEIQDGLGHRRGLPPLFPAAKELTDQGKGLLSLTNPANARQPVHQQQEIAQPWPLGRMTRWYLWACLCSTLFFEVLFWLRDRRTKRFRGSDGRHHVEAYAQFLKQV